MKAKKILFYFLMFLPVLLTVILLPFLPEQIPAHYDLHHQVTRWGSKYEAFIFPALTIAFGLFMLGISSYASKQEAAGKNNENICITAGILTLLLFNVLTGYSLYTDFHKIEDLSAVTVDINQLVFGILGVSLIIIGNIMPKTRRNSLMGLRTVWSMKNETTWKKSQRFGGILFIITGLLILIISIFVKGNACMICSLVILFATLPVSVYYTYRTAEKYDTASL